MLAEIGGSSDHSETIYGMALLRGARSFTWLLASLVGLVGMALVVLPAVTGGRIPGDLSDARFNSFLLEHVNRWLRGLDTHFWGDGSYFPYPLTTAIGDNFLGDGPVYAVFRLLGADREAAFNLWYAASFVANYAAAHFALVRLGYSRIASALGAFLFAFGLPVTGQEIHAQLAYRFGVPMAVLCLIRLRKGGSLFLAVAVLFWLAWQLFCSIYIGFFLALLLLALWLSTTDKLQFEGDWARGGWFPGSWSTASASERLAATLACLGIIAFMILFMVPYAEVSRLYGFRRSWSEISQFLPRPQSYLMANGSRIWPSSGGLFARIPVGWEHGMFIGAAPYLTMAVAWALRIRGKIRPDPLVRPMVVSVALLVVLTLCNDPIYRVLIEVPGVSAIRSVTRIILVMMFPFAILLASAIDGIMSSSPSPTVRFTLVGLAAGLLILESADVDHTTTTVGQWRARVASVRAQLPARLPHDPILFVAPPIPNEINLIDDADAMILSQDRGWPTLNGYSIPRPPGYPTLDVCMDVDKILKAGIFFDSNGGRSAIDGLRRRVVVVGDNHCKAPSFSGARANAARNEAYGEQS